MKKALVIALSCLLIFTGCESASVENNENLENTELSTSDNNDSELEESLTEDEVEDSIDEESLDFKGLDDPELLGYVENSVYADLNSDIASEGYVVENVEAIYYPKEYIEELNFNSQENIYFGYTASELDAFFGDTKYVFTLGDDGQTIVVPMNSSEPEDYGKVIEDVIIGSGVILICVTIAPVAAAAGAPAISTIFACSASGAYTFAKSGAVISGAAAAITTAYQTEDFEQSVKAGIEASASGFKWGAITGAVIDGGAEAIGLKMATKNGLTMNEAAIIKQESGFPIQLIKQFKSLDEYNVYKKAGLYTKTVNGRTLLVRDIDPNYEVTLKDGTKITNRELMAKGNAPYDATTGVQIDLHHINQDRDGALAMLTKTEHQENYSILHNRYSNGVHNKETGDKAWEQTKKEIWKAIAEQYT